MESLDEAVGQSSFFDPVTPPPKKAKLGRSFYATLAKSGIKKDPKPCVESHTSIDNPYLLSPILNSFCDSDTLPATQNKRDDEQTGESIQNGASSRSDFVSDGFTDSEGAPFQES